MTESLYMPAWCRMSSLLLIALGGCAVGGARVPDDAVVISNGTVIDGTGHEPITDGIVVLQDDRVIAVGEAAEFSIPRDARVVDAKGGTIMPGIINSHTHATDDPATRRAFLIDGVTTVCNVGISLDRLLYGFQFNYEVATPAEARSAVADLVSRGASMIKITLAPGDPQDPWPILDLERVQAIVEEAHRLGVLVRAHVFEPYLVEDIVLLAGVDVIEHSPFPILSVEEETSVLESDDPRTTLFEIVAPEFDTLLARVVEQGIVMVPTLDGNIGTLYRKPDRSRVEQIVVDVHVEAVHRFHALDGVVALGNDFGAIPDVQPGMPMTEMSLLLEAGLTPLEVILAGTRNAAFVCGQGDRLGTLEPGKLADLIVVDGDPLTDLQAMQRVVLVLKDGDIAYTAN
jgi:imidazolonepropionase-like amidohydrolase